MFAMSCDAHVQGLPLRPRATGRLACCSVLIAAGSARAQCAIELSKIVDVESQVLTYFGTAVDCSGNRAIIGLSGGAMPDGVDVFVKSGTWERASHIDAPDPGDPGSFGSRVAIDGVRAAVGAWSYGGSGLGSGRAYIYEDLGNEWTLVETLADESEETALFGRAVAVSGDVIAVGAEGDVQTPGRVFVYRRSGSETVLEAVVAAPVPLASDSFGYSVDVCGDVVLVGCQQSPANGFAHAYRFSGSSWVHEAQFDPMNAGDPGEVDVSLDVAIVGDTILRHADGFWLAEGSVAEGASADIGPESVVVGISKDDDVAKDAGAAILYRFDGSTWVMAEKFYASDAEMNNEFGHAVALEGATAFVSAIFGDGAVNGSGVVYEFDVAACLPREPCAADCNADGSLNIFDFLCFQGLVTEGESGADCNADSLINIFDFLCFQGLVTEGCG